ncbi:hypothetical protein ACFRAU_14215 [Arthrobacter sp. NPDC056691]
MTTSRLDALPNVGAPATRAWNATGYATLKQLARVPAPNCQSYTR